MSYYMGDYYRGDPFWGSLFGAVKRIGGALLGVGGGGGVAQAGAPAGAGMAMIKAGGQRAIQVAQRAIVKHPVVSAAAAAGALAGAGAVVGRVTRRGMMVTPEGIPIRKRRRMNACNARALRRALRRAYAFERIAMRTIHLVHPKKKARFGGFKKRRRAA